VKQLRNLYLMAVALNALCVAMLFYLRSFHWSIWLIAICSLATMTLWGYMAHVLVKEGVEERGLALLAFRRRHPRSALIWLDRLTSLVFWSACLAALWHYFR
jgi:hypothetical protein